MRVDTAEGAGGDFGAVGTVIFEVSGVELAAGLNTD